MLLISKEGTEFEVELSAARASNLVRSLVEENQDEDVPLQTVSTPVLARIVEFMQYHVHTPLQPIAKPLRSADASQCFAPEWYCTFIAQFSENELVELASAANFLDLPPLLDLSCAAIALSFRTKTTEELIQFLKLENCE